MAAVIICSEFRAHGEEICHYFHNFLPYLPCSNGAGCHDLSFLIFSLKPALSLSSFSLIKRLFSSSLFAISGIICISEVVDDSPTYLDSSL